VAVCCLLLTLMMMLCVLFSFAERKRGSDCGSHRWATTWIGEVVVAMDGLSCCSAPENIHQKEPGILFC